jgi:membrane protein implicated in regulation of membrane protease activity
MLGIYILSAMLGGGLLLFSLLSGAHHDVGDVDAPVDVDASFDADVSGVDADMGGMDADHDFHVGHDAAGELVLGLFRPRNLIFFMAAFGITGTLLTWTGTPEGSTLGMALGMGGGAWLMTYGVFTWLRRSDVAVEALSEREIEGRAGRVELPVSPGESGRISCLIADREQYITARLAPDVSRRLEPGDEVVIVRVEDGVAEVIPFDAPELLPPES